jgi:hypothetical protein
MGGLVDLDDIYFAADSWTGRLDRWIQQHSATDTFAAANATAVDVVASRRDLGLRMAVNIPAYALLLFLREGHYKNAYERWVEAGDKAAPSPTRCTVDDALFPPPLRPGDYYFGAVVLGGTGVRYYGDYCIVLKEDASVIPEGTQMLDRNSYDIVFAPLAGRESLRDIVERLRGEWATDRLAMAKMKILPALGISRRLTTAGGASETLLHDESFVEVHKEGSFGPADVHEIREAAADAAVEADIIGRRERGHLLSVEEIFWVARRHAVDRELASLDVPARIVVSGGRTPR